MFIIILLYISTECLKKTLLFKKMYLKEDQLYYLTSKSH